MTTALTKHTADGISSYSDEDGGVWFLFNSRIGELVDVEEGSSEEVEDIDVAEYTISTRGYTVWAN